MDCLIDLYRKAEDYFFRGISLQCLDLSDQSKAYMVGTSNLNFIYISRDIKFLDDILIKGRNFFDQLSFSIIIPQELCVSDMKNILHEMGCKKKSQSISMVVDLEKIVLNKFFEDEFVIISTDNKLNEWIMPLIEAFDSSFEDGSIYATAHENALKNNINIRHFSLLKNNHIVSSVSLSIYDDHIARIDDVGTLPEFQRKGYATYLMHYILLAAKNLGIRYCFLESSFLGFRMYQKLCFKTLFKNNIYSIE